MKEKITFAMVLLSSVSFAQTGRVGINTETPNATLNVKSNNDATTPKNLELENQNGTKLVTVLNNGNVGIGETTPESKLVIKTNVAKNGFQLVDTNEGEDRILTSDANGNATWKERQIYYQKLTANLTADFEMPTSDTIYTIPGLEKYTAKKSGYYMVSSSFFISPTNNEGQMYSFYFRIDSNNGNKLLKENYMYGKGYFLTSSYNGIIFMEKNEEISFSLMPSVNTSSNKKLILHKDLASRNSISIAYLGN